MHKVIRLFLQRGRTIRQVRETFDKVHSRCSSKWAGFKAPDLCLITPAQLVMLEPRLVVRTYRDRESTVKSLAETRANARKGRKHWERFYAEREVCLRYHTDHLRNVGIPVVEIHIPRYDEPKLDRERLDRILALAIQRHLL
jgi:hypothetical protein